MGAFLSLAPGPASATDVRIAVRGVKSNAGTVLAAVCPRASFLQPGCPFEGRAPARKGVTVVTVAGVPPGEYAAQAFHDANDSGEIDRNLLGIPIEGIGFSRDAPFRFGPPRFAEAVLSLAGPLVAIDITLKFEP